MKTRQETFVFHLQNYQAPAKQVWLTKFPFTQATETIEVTYNHWLEH